MKSLAFSSPRSQKWARLLSQFLSGQVIIQLLNFATGFLLLRWLSVTAYAQFSVAFAFQSTLGMLIDLGFSNSIVALVGNRGDDGNIVGHYIRSAKHFRNRMFVVMICLSAVAFPLVTRSQHWPLSTQVLLFGAVVFSLFFQGWGMYAAPLLINGRIKEFYQAQIIAAVGRLFCCFLLYSLAVISAWTVAWAAGIGLAITGVLYQKKARPYIVEPNKSDPFYNAEMMRYLAPLIPVVVFTALQGQITILLMSLFGKTESIANFAALGRLGQILLVFAAFNSVIVEPYFAKVAPAKLTKRYIQALFGAIGVTLLIGTAAFVLPQPLLWLLGSKYQGLGSYVGWIVSISCLNYLVAGTLFTINSARKWRFWWYSFLEIPLLLVAQALAISLTNVGTLRGAVAFSLMTSVGWFLTHLICGVYGLVQNRRSLVKEASGSISADMSHLEATSR